MTAVRLLDIDANETRMSVREWGTPGAPPLVLVAGTGLAAAIFEETETLLASEWHGYSVDRRGQGLSAKPEAGYEFSDLADDLAAVVQALGLRGAAGIGHSAGGTDMLLAAARDPGRWSRMAVIEPTVQDPRRPPALETDPPSWAESSERNRRRRAAFDSLDHALARFMTNPGFARCRRDRVRRYLEAALEPGEDGSWRLRCTPAIEGEMNRRIMQAMSHRYSPPDGREPPFDGLSALRLPVTVLTTGQSGDIYRAMARIAADVIPRARTAHLPDLGHIVPLESPETIAALAASLR
jgi:pimeloyl-ACP methyl ester carboxylesterase